MWNWYGYYLYETSCPDRSVSKEEDHGGYGVCIEAILGIEDIGCLSVGLVTDIEKLKIDICDYIVGERSIFVAFAQVRRPELVCQASFWPDSMNKYATNVFPKHGFTVFAVDVLINKQVRVYAVAYL